MWMCFWRCPQATPECKLDANDDFRLVVGYHIDIWYLATLCAMLTDFWQNEEDNAA